MKPRVSATGSQAPPYVPRFGRPPMLVPDDFWSNLKQFLTERPVKVREHKDAPFTRTSFGTVLAAVIALLMVPIAWHVVPTIQAKNKVDVTLLDISPYIAKLPAGANKAGGGGGANDHTTAPVNRGKVPKFKWTQFAPPQVRIQ